MALSPKRSCAQQKDTIMPDFRELLAKPVDSYEAPPPLVAGTYQGVVEAYKWDESREKKTPFCDLTIRLTAPGEDIDPSELVGIDITKRKLNQAFYITEEAGYRLKEFLHSCGVETAGKGWGECVPEVLNAQVLVDVILKPNTKDATKPPYPTINNIRGLAD